MHTVLIVLSPFLTTLLFLLIFNNMPCIPRLLRDRIFLMCLTISGYISSCDCPAPFLKQGQWSTTTGNTNIYVYVAPTVRKRNELTWEQGMHTTKWHQFAGRWWFDTLPHKRDRFGMVTESNGMVGGWLIPPTGLHTVRTTNL